jgi:hypothetical protein
MARTSVFLVINFAPLSSIVLCTFMYLAFKEINLLSHLYDHFYQILLNILYILLKNVNTNGAVLPVATI